MKVEVSVGESFDKLSILSIKLKKISDEIKRANVQKEYTSLLEIVNLNQQSVEVLSLFTQLCDINEKLWVIEDEIRLKESKKEFDQEFIELARSVYYTNDKRFEIKRKINLVCDSKLIEEKQHEKYN